MSAPAATTTSTRERLPISKLLNRFVAMESTRGTLMGADWWRFAERWRIRQALRTIARSARVAAAAQPVPTRDGAATTLAPVAHPDRDGAQHHALGAPGGGEQVDQGAEEVEFGQPVQFAGGSRLRRLAVEFQHLLAPSPDFVRALGA